MIDPHYVDCSVENELSHLSLNVLTIEWPLQYKSYLRIRLILGFMKDITDFFPMKYY